ncbi:protein FAM43A-like [Patiria miniata]|uniref:PID domain-containing protein n=1 Tax=Patiria miniata TaxID=46514 RepID=A0A913ZJ33_PATMI|nr:protein FAM43A-like [Patiria miniata]
MALSMFKRKPKSSVAAAAAASPKEKTFTIQYLGSLRTFKGKGSDCLDEPLQEIWVKSNKGTRSAKAQLTIAADGVNLERMDIKDLPTSVQFFHLNRISHCGLHPKYPRVVTWIHRNELQRMQVEMRAHAVICNRSDKARMIADLLNERLRSAFADFKQEMKVRDKISIRRSSEGTLDVAGLQKLQNHRSTFMPPVAKRGSVPALGIILEKGKLVGVAETIEADEEEEEDEDGDTF